MALKVLNFDLVGVGLATPHPLRHLHRYQKRWPGPRYRCVAIGYSQYAIELACQIEDNAHVNVVAQSFNAKTLHELLKHIHRCVKIHSSFYGFASTVIRGFPVIVCSQHFPHRLFASHNPWKSQSSQVRILSANNKTIWKCIYLLLTETSKWMARVLLSSSTARGGDATIPDPVLMSWGSTI